MASTARLIGVETSSGIGTNVRPPQPRTLIEQYFRPSTSCKECRRPRRVVLWAGSSGNGEFPVSVHSAQGLEDQQQVPWPPPGRSSPFIDSWSELERPDEPDRIRATNRPRKKMSEDHKRKIQETLKGRGQGEKKSPEHREKIRQSMLRRMNMDSTHRLRISSSSKGKPKVCRLCGEAGHNRRSCKLNNKEGQGGGDTRQLIQMEGKDELDQSSSDRGRAGGAAAAGRASGKNGGAAAAAGDGESGKKSLTTRRPQRCSACGEPGHNRTTCPHYAAPERRRAKVKVCSLCKQPGHNARTCPSRSVKEQLNLPDEPPSAQPLALRAASASRTAPGNSNTAAQQRRQNPIPGSQAAQGTQASLEQPGSSASSQKPFAEAAQILPLPLKKRHMCQAAVRAASVAFRDGIRYQRVELSLQESVKQGLDMESWPGGIREQFGVALPLAELVLSGLKQDEGFSGRMSAEVLDDADAVGCWQNDKLAAVLFPTADTLERVRELCQRKDGSRMVVLINPQWQGEGQVISDFGFGKSRYDAEEFVETFQPTFCLRSLRLLGQNVSLYRCYPGMWQVHVVNRLGQAECLGADLTEPSYRRITELVRRHLDKNTTWLDRVRLGNLWPRR